VALTVVHPRIAGRLTDQEIAMSTNEHTASHLVVDAEALRAEVGVEYGELTGAGFTNVAVGLPTDSFGDAAGEDRGRAFEVFGRTFRGRRP
jgi:hypothetical protein